LLPHAGVWHKGGNGDRFRLYSMTTQTDAENSPRKEPLSFGWVLLLSLHLLVLAIAIPEAFRWTDRWMGLVSGLISGGILALVGAVVLLPVVLVVKLLSRWWKPGRITRALLIGLPLVLLVVQLLNPVNPAERFRSRTDVALPANLTGMRSYLSGGGFSDRIDEYYFETTQEEVDRLIRELALNERGEPYGLEQILSSLPETPTDWPGAVSYYGDRNSKVFYSLITDGARRRVWIRVLRI